MGDTCIYRVTVKTTGSVQPTATFWEREVIYCGTDRDDARIAYHGSTPLDYYYGHGNKCRETVAEEIDDAETEDFSDDVVSKASTSSLKRNCDR